MGREQLPRTKRVAMFNPYNQALVPVFNLEQNSEKSKNLIWPRETLPMSVLYPVLFWRAVLEWCLLLYTIC